jgi:hypothetical protein
VLDHGRVALMKFDLQSAASDQGIFELEAGKKVGPEGTACIRSAHGQLSPELKGRVGALPDRSWGNTL